MSTDKPELYTTERALIESFPVETVKQFVSDIQKNLKPSFALDNFAKANSCSEPDSSVIVDLLKRAYENIDISIISGLVQGCQNSF